MQKKRLKRGVRVDIEHNDTQLRMGCCGAGERGGETLAAGIVFIAPGTSDQVVTALVIACASIMAYVALEPFNSSFLHRTKAGCSTVHPPVHVDTRRFDPWA